MLDNIFSRSLAIFNLLVGQFSFKKILFFFIIEIKSKILEFRKELFSPTRERHQTKQNKRQVMSKLVNTDQFSNKFHALDKII